MISFIIPAHNEEALIGATLRELHAAAAEVGDPFELILVADACTDGTAKIAAAGDARVICVQHRQIAATRNAGARAAAGEFLFFVDADTQANAAAIRAALHELRAGAVAGGCLFRFEGRLPLWARVIHPFFIRACRLMRQVGGCFLFCTRDAFLKVGGFSEDYFAAEETAFTKSMKQLGRFAIPRETVITSGRKLREFSAWQLVRPIAQWLLRGPSAFRRREGLEVWYGPRTSGVKEELSVRKTP